jgi:hypothetical protein
MSVWLLQCHSVLTHAVCQVALKYAVYPALHYTGVLDRIMPSSGYTVVTYLCLGCGKMILEGRTHCGLCAVSTATERFIYAARVGRQTANSPEAQLKRANTQRQNALAQHAWKPSDQPTWLTELFYAAKSQTLLASLSASTIARQISVSRWYVGRIREGYRPSPRHWRGWVA